MSRSTPPGTLATRPPALGAARLRPLPAFGAVLGVLLVFGVIASFQVGLDGSFRDLGGAAPRAGTPPVCLALAYTPPGDFRWLPDSLRLTSEIRHRSDRGTWYRAADPRGYAEGWRPAGPDSIDLSGHHLPVSRIPSHGAHRVGRGGWLGYTNVWDAFLSRPWRVDAREIACWRE